jgi:serine/threonine-protein kinase
MTESPANRMEPVHERFHRDSATKESKGLFGASLPTSVVRDSVHRLEIMALVGAGMMVLGVFMRYVIAPAIGLEISALDDEFFVPFGIVGLLSSLGLFWAARFSKLPPQLLLDLGLAYMVVISLGIAINHHWLGIRIGDNNGLSWLPIWIMTYSMIVPSTPRRTYAAAFIAAFMWWIGMGVAGLRGYEMPSLAQTLFSNFPNAIAAGVAGIPAVILKKLGHQVKKAQEMGSYHLEKLLGRGGMGEVWEARHRMLARPAAIKLIRSDRLGADNPEGAQTALQRFEREAQATAVLRSPHTVELYDFGITKDGTFYYVMELLEGMDLETLVNRFGPQSAERVVHLLRQACHSLADAHQCNMVHRDIKPANLYACRMGIDVDFVKVLDFGLVKAQGDMDAASRLTADDVTTGTPAYMPPEAATGESEVNAQSDIYALGCVAYWLLTAELVFEGDTPVNTIIQHVREKPVPPSQRTEREVPAALERIVMDCLEKKPEARPPSAAELERRLAETGIGAGWSGERAQAWWQAHIPKGPTPCDTATPEEQRAREESLHTIVEI